MMQMSFLVLLMPLHFFFLLCLVHPQDKEHDICATRGVPRGPADSAMVDWHAPEAHQGTCMRTSLRLHVVLIVFSLG